METVVLLAFVLQETVKMGQIPGQLQASVNVMGTVVGYLHQGLLVIHINLLQESEWQCHLNNR
jgi:hypothetical protein